MEIKRGKQRLPPRILLYGPEGIGKSTFAADAGALMLSVESGLGEIDCASVDCSDSFGSIMGALASLHKDSQGFPAVCIDTLDWTERLIWQGICSHYNVATIEKAAGGYGKGFAEAVTQWWQPLLNQLRLLQLSGMAVILTAHAKVEKFDDPENPAYDRWSPRLHKLATGIVCEWVDATLFATRKVRVADDDKSKTDRAIAKPIGGAGGDRIIRTVGGPACVAKNRYSLPEELPLNWQSFIQAMAG